jgi:hypothetical protein
MRNKLSETFLQALANDFVQHGPAVIEQVRQQRPHHYLSVIAGLCPRKLHVERHSPFADLSDAELTLLEDFLRSTRAKQVTEIDGAAADPSDP